MRAVYPFCDISGMENLDKLRTWLLEVDDLNSAASLALGSDFGIAVPDDRHGVLQDMH